MNQTNSEFCPLNIKVIIRLNKFNNEISASCNRVAVIDGHTENVSMSFVNKPAPTPEEVKFVLASYRAPHEDLFMSPDTPIIVRDECDRPQPKLDRDSCKGQAVTVGRIRECSIFDIKFTLLSHNTILGVIKITFANN